MSLRPRAKASARLRLQRPGQRDLIDADAELGGALFGDAELGERLPHVEIGFAGGDDAEPRLRRIDHHAVEAVGAGERLRRGELWAVQAALLLDRPIHAAARPADVQPARRHFEIARHRHRDALRIDVDRRGAVDRFARRLERHPASGKPRQRETEQAEIEIILDRRRIEHRHHRRLERLLALIRGGGAFARRDRRRRWPARRRAARCRPNWRGAARRASGRRRGLCRTRCRTRHRPWRRETGRPAGCPTPRWRRGLRSARAGSGCRCSRAAPWPATARCRRCRAASRDSRR